MAPKDVDEIRQLLAAVRWIRCGKNNSLKALATHLGVTTPELRRNFQTLSLVGLPPFSPGDLVEADIDQGRVSLRQLGALGQRFSLSEDDVWILWWAADVANKAKGDGGNSPSLSQSLHRAMKGLLKTCSPNKARELKEVASRVCLRPKGQRAPNSSPLRVLLEVSHEALCLAFAPCQEVLLQGPIPPQSDHIRRILVPCDDIDGLARKIASMGGLARALWPMELAQEISEKINALARESLR